MDFTIFIKLISKIMISHQKIESYLGNFAASLVVVITNYTILEIQLSMSFKILCCNDCLQIF
jgi:hypothetical protein